MSQRHFAPALLEKSAAAFYISVKERKFDDFVSRGLLTPYRLDGKKVYRREDLDALADSLPEWEPRQ